MWVKQNRMLRRFRSWKKLEPYTYRETRHVLVMCETGEALVNSLLKALKLLGLQHTDTWMGSVVQPLSNNHALLKPSPFDE